MPRLGPVSAWKPAYLIHGDDHGRIGERRANLRRKAEEEAGAQGVEAFEGDDATPAAVAAALSAMTFSMGHRFLVVDGVERWKEADVKAHLVPALKAMDDGTTIAFFGRDDGRAKTPAALVDGGQEARRRRRRGGDAQGEGPPALGDDRGRKLGLKLDNAARAAARRRGRGASAAPAARAREARARARAGRELGEEEVAAVAAPSAERQVWGLVDALVAREHRKATRAFLELRDQGESLPRLIPLIARRLREVLAVAVKLEAGESPAQVKATLKMAPWAADRRIKEARATDADALRAALESLAGARARLARPRRRLGGHRRAADARDDHGLSVRRAVHRPLVAGPEARPARSMDVKPKDESARRTGAEGRGPRQDAEPRTTSCAARSPWPRDVAAPSATGETAQARRPRRAARKGRPRRIAPQRARGCGAAKSVLARLAPARTRAARDFLRAPVLRCSAPRLTALSIIWTSCGAPRP